MSADADRRWMRRAIALAAAQLGATGVNPAVGCVLVRDGEAIGEGATGTGGRPHAEEQALEAAGEQARGAVAYVTLEPCGARSAGGASCAERLANAGVARVVVAAADPSAYARGRGLMRIAQSGVALETGVLGAEAQTTLYADYRPSPEG